MPRLWDETIEVHRRAVHEAILDTAAALVSERGLLSLTMSKVAEETGIGRATLYKYFPDVGSVLAAWHDRLVTAHLRHLIEARDGAGDAVDQLEAVLEAYALMTYARPHDTELAAAVHRGVHLEQARQRLKELIGDVLSAAVKTGDVRDDVPPEELASYCVRALGAAGDLSSQESVRRLVGVTLTGLRR